METQQITIKDIAKALGMSVSTVSRALNDRWDISKATKERVQEYARQHRYTPNSMASNLRKSKVTPNNVIGVIVPEFVHYYFSCILTGIEDESKKHGFTLMVAHSGEKYENERVIVENFCKARVSGLIVSQAKDTKKYDHFQHLIDLGIPIVFYDRICTGVVTSRVVVDDYAGAYNAVDYLIRTGCRRIAFFSADKSLEISKNRFNGYRDALLAHNLPIDEQLVRYCDNFQQAKELTPYLLHFDRRPDAFFAINDETALGILYTCKSYGLRIPEDVSICGFTNSDLSRVCDPMLTSVEQRGYDVGKTAAATLINMITSKDGSIRNSVVKTKLVIRGTTRRLPDEGINRD